VDVQQAAELGEVACLDGLQAALPELLCDIRGEPPGRAHAQVRPVSSGLGYRRCVEALPTKWDEPALRTAHITEP